MFACKNRTSDVINPDFQGRTELILNFWNLNQTTQICNRTQTGHDKMKHFYKLKLSSFIKPQCTLL